MAGVNDNLIPPKKGEIRNPKGKPKGTKHLSTWIQNMLNDEDFDTYIKHPTKGFEEFKGAPIKAIVTVAMRKALDGDDKAMEWLAKHGYGTKQILEFTDPAEAVLERFGLKGNQKDARETEEPTDTSP